MCYITERGCQEKTNRVQPIETTVAYRGGSRRDGQDDLKVKLMREINHKIEMNR